jgi:hypothetical protein
MAEVVADEKGRIFALDGKSHVMYENVWDFLARRRHAQVRAEDVPRGRPDVECHLPEDAVRLWQTIPTDKLIVRMPQGKILVSTATHADDVPPAQHLRALVCSLLSGGPEWNRPSPASQFVWSMCTRMAVSKEAEKRRRKAATSTSAIYTLDVTASRGQISETLSVADILVRAHEDVLRNHRNNQDVQTPVGTSKLEAELRAYAAIAKKLARSPLPAWYKKYENGELGEEAPYPLPKQNATDGFDLLTDTLALDALCISHAKFARDTKSGVAALTYLKEGTDNVVFRIGKAALRVRKVPQSAREQIEANAERSIWLALAGQGVVPETIAMPTVLLGGLEHSAVVMQRFHDNLDSPEPGSNMPAIEEALVELYARLSTVATCVDTKPGNVVWRTFKRHGAPDGTALALIDTDGYRCAASQLADNVPWDAYIGPICLDDLAYALSIAQEQESPAADSPLLFSAICLLVFHVREAYARRKTQTRYVRTRRLLHDYFDTVWKMMEAHDKFLRHSQKAVHMVSHYGHLEPGKEKEGAKKLLFQLFKSPPSVTNDTHARAYWSGVERLIDDLRRRGADPGPEESALGAKIRHLAVERYTDVDEYRLKAHIALAERRFADKRLMLTDGVRDGRYKLGEALNEFFVRNACSVDRLTAQAFVEVIQESARQQPPVDLYTEEPESGSEPSARCASAIAALLDST